jgi:translation initiation factor 3 subunit E
MVDFAIDTFQNLYPDKEVPASFKDKRTEVVAELKRLQAETDPIIKIFEDQEIAESIQNTRDGRQLFDFLSKSRGFKMEMLDTLYRFAKFQYECGNYSGAAEYLYFVRVLLPPTDRNYMNALWGKLASEILMQDWDTALDDLTRLREVLDSNMSWWWCRPRLCQDV